MNALGARAGFLRLTEGRRVAPLNMVTIGQIGQTDVSERSQARTFLGAPVATSTGASEEDFPSGKTAVLSIGQGTEWTTA